MLSKWDHYYLRKLIEEICCDDDCCCEYDRHHLKLEPLKNSHEIDKVRQHDEKKHYRYCECGCGDYYIKRKMKKKHHPNIDVWESKKHKQKWDCGC
ncbi:hypothetical protein TMU01_09610 [Tenuibacillus multivorans]|nr:hypothetical protein TMU01_09610 [Tenuibacillus multivorans]